MENLNQDRGSLTFCVVRGVEATRLDALLAGLVPEVSRSQLQRWVKAGDVLVDHKQVRPRDQLLGGETVLINVPEAPMQDWAAQTIPLDIVFEDDQILVLNKPAGLVVHPGAGNPDNTLLNALLSHAPALRSLARAGIVHRLDKDTSGLMVIAKTERARLSLIDQLSTRELHRQYTTIVNGVMISGGTVDEPIGRHPKDRKRMAVVSRGKPAISHYRVIERFRAHTLVDVKLETGRTHQIRVHMAYIHFPVLGDPVYGGRLKLPPDSDDMFVSTLRNFRRQALHARKLGLIHPITGKEMFWEAPMPVDMEKLIAVLRADLQQHGE
ncbi:MAG: 23S rRNA pseudouridine(1911/1915/1917) synthase RluD [Acidiferrobacterales bacterium]|jgi:23S rRNA pseudouridine1911/1915/1917 synthase|nr:23S rRNA pseudouridine(1911/1915/1917) synthase RluD [Acidiferrobacterales bacterium]